MDPVVHAERIAGCLVGLLVGDALAVPYDGYPISMLPQRELIDLPPKPGWRSLHPQAPPGAYSESGATTLMLLSTLLNSGTLDSHSFMLRMREWLHQGLYAAESLTFDVNLQTQRAIKRFAAGVPVERCGNGAPAEDPAAIPRTIALVLAQPQLDDAALVALAQQQAALTHDTPLSRVGAALVALWLRAELEQQPKPWHNALKRLTGLLTRGDALHEALFRGIRPERVHHIGDSYRVDALIHVVRASLFNFSDYPSSLRLLVSFGDNVTGASALLGAFAGARVGLYNIPAAWRNHLSTQGLITVLLHQLLNDRGLPLVDI